MPVDSTSQLTLNFEAGLTDTFKTCLACVQDRVYKNPMPIKTIAADMDLSPSELSRKLGDNPNDVRQFTLGDFESYLAATKDYQPLYYLIEKHLAEKDLQKLLRTEQQEKERLRAELEALRSAIQIKEISA